LQSNSTPPFSSAASEIDFAALFIVQVFVMFGEMVPALQTSARSGSPNYSDATRDDQLGRQALHHIVPMIASQASHRNDSAIWPGSRGSNIQHFTFDQQTVTGPGWIWPIKFDASPNDTVGERQAALDQ
jgi:hypothetical protein